jgi:leucyl/phenylalanyl-tRNA--protein transferase
VKSIFDLPRLGDNPASPFPPIHQALESPNGLLAWGGDLSPERLLRAYRAGIFPWYTDGEPLLWWSPAPRCVVLPGEVYLSRRTRRRYNSGQFRLTADTAFTDVLAACAGPRKSEQGTWITAEMAQAYRELHQLGHAHSVEVWENTKLVGGIYGLALGSMFFGESMFSHRNDASKLALVALCRQLQAWDYGLLDCQVGNPHLFRMGAKKIARTAFEQILAELTHVSRAAGSWQKDFVPEERW